MILFNLDRNGGPPLFKQIFVQLKALIEKGALKPGDRLPSTRSLAETLSVHRSTVYKAYEELWAFGYLESRPGSYSRVRKKAALATFTQKKSQSSFNWGKVCSPAASQLYGQFTRMQPALKKSGPSGMIDFSTLELDSRLFPVEGFRKCMNQVLTDHGKDLLKYGTCTGYQPLREFIAQRLQIHGISSSWEEILITNGAQHGYDLILRLLATPGSRVLVESPTYALVLPILSFYQVETIGIPMESTGVNLRSLEKEMIKDQTSFFYTIPNFQNPTGITTTHSHREALLSLCEKYQVPLIEDAFEEEMKYFGKVPLPIKSMDKQQLVIYLGTFSKVLFPGIRVGWIAAHRDCIERLTALKRFSELSSGNVIQAALAEFCRQGRYDVHIKRLHRIYRKRMQCVLEGLKKSVNHNQVTWTEPTGGYLIWLKMAEIRKSQDEILQIFQANGIRMASGDPFFPYKRPKQHFRLSISTLDEEEINVGIQRLGKAVDQIYSR